MYSEQERQDQLSGEHVAGPTRLAEEESRKNKYFGMFHFNKESVGGHTGDRNKMGSKDKMKSYE